MRISSWSKVAPSCLLWRRCAWACFCSRNEVNSDLQQSFILCTYLSPIHNLVSSISSHLFHSIKLSCITTNYLFYCNKSHTRNTRGTMAISATTIFLSKRKRHTVLGISERTNLALSTFSLSLLLCVRSLLAMISLTILSTCLFSETKQPVNAALYCVPECVSLCPLQAQ